MRRLALVVLLAACANGGGDAVAPDTSPLPWLAGYTVTAASDASTPAARRQLTQLAGPTADEDDADPAISVGDADGSVVASYRRGVVAATPDGRVVARAPGFEPMGSADDIVAVAVGDARIGGRVIAVAVNAGGHRESATTLVLYRVAAARLEPVFAAPVELHDGDTTWSGQVLMMPYALLYRAPRSTQTTLWTFDPKRGRYVERAQLPAAPLAQR